MKSAYEIAKELWNDDANISKIASAIESVRTEATAEALARAGEAAQKAIRGNDVMVAAETS